MPLRPLLVTALALVVASPACKPSRPEPAPAPAPVRPTAPVAEAALPAQATGTPDPPFSSELPADALVWDREGATPGRYGGQLVLPIEVNPKSFNPVVANETSTTELVRGPIYLPLSSFDPVRFEERLLLARAREVSPDGLVWTYHLRRGLRWSDGQPFTAGDVLFNFELVFDPSTPSSDRDLFTDSEGRLPKVERLDDHTVRFSLTQLNVLFESAVGSVYLIPKHVWEGPVREKGISRVLGLDTPPEQVVGMGPFRVKSLETDQRVLLERNPWFAMRDRYGNRLPYLDRVVWLVLPDANTSLLRFLAGEVQLLSRVSAEQVDLLELDAAKGGFALTDLGPSLSTHYLTFNLNPGSGPDGAPLVKPWLRAIFEDVRFRRAVSHALDRKAMVRTALLGRGRPLYCIVSPANRAWFHECPAYPYDRAKSEALLAEMGLVDRDGDGVREDGGGNAVVLTAITNVENTVRVAELNVIKANLAEVGIRVVPRPMPFNALITRFNTTYEWEAIVLGWGSGVPPDPVMSKNIYLSSGRTHVWHPKQQSPARTWEAEIDGLVGRLETTLDPVLRKATHDRIVDILGEQQPQVFTFGEDVFVAARKEIGNLRPVVVRPYATWNLHELFLK